jgi:conjugal transfer pilus assembly protein TraK
MSAIGTGMSAGNFNMAGLIGSSLTGLARALRRGRGARSIAAAVSAGGLAMTASPALADQNLLVSDNGTVECVASSKDLTRISLKADKFANVSKVAAPSETEDFSVVFEPLRGDIYLSVPEGYPRKALSFFGTTVKGYVYKFTCNVQSQGAEQIFVANVDMEKAGQSEQVAGLSDKDRSIELIQAMYRQDAVPGFEIRSQDRAPVQVGSLKVQLVSEYVGLELRGKQLLIENASRKPVDVSDDTVASDGALAVSVTSARLEPGQKTTAFIVSPVEGHK